MLHKVVLPFEFVWLLTAVDKTIQMEAIEQYFPKLLFTMPHKVVMHVFV